MKRPFRLELNGLAFSVNTYATEASARDAIAKVCRMGDKWRIVERRRELNARGRPCTRRHVIAEGVA